MNFAPLLIKAEGSVSYTPDKKLLIVQEEKLSSYEWTYITVACH
jgi:hypothetical protein